MDYRVAQQQREPYFSVMQKFNNAVTERRYTQALMFLRTGLSLTVPAVASMKAEWGGSNPSVPFLGTTAGAVAALFDDTEVFDLMEEANNSLNYVVKTEVERYRQDAQLVSGIRETLSNSPETTTAELKRTASKADQARISRLLSWMEKNQELSLEKDGKTTVVRAGAPTIKPLITYPTFRSGAVVQPTRSYGVPDIETPYISYDERTEQTKNSNAAKVFSDFREHPLQAEQRQPGAMATHLLREGMWLIGTSRSKPDGSFLTPIVVLTHSGETIRKLELRHKAVRVFSSYERNHLVILDSILGVHVYLLDGSELRGFSLDKNPEFESVFGLLDESYKATAVVRSVDVSPRSGDVAFSILDKVWRFTSDGEPQIALHMKPGAGQPNEPGTELAAVAGKEIVLAQTSGAGWATDWVYFVRFSEIDDSVFIGTYSGHLVKVARSGEVESTWQLGGSVTELVEDVEHVIAPTYDLVNLLKETGEVEKVEAAGTVFVKAAYTVTRQGREIAVVDNATLAVTRYLMNRDVKAVYPRNGALRVDMTTTYAELSLPTKTLA